MSIPKIDKICLKHAHKSVSEKSAQAGAGIASSLRELMTFLCLACLVGRDFIEARTHGALRVIGDVYTSMSWATTWLEKEFKKLKKAKDKKGKKKN